MDSKIISTEELENEATEIAGALEPDVEPLSAEEIEAIRRRRMVAAEMGEAVKAEDKAASDHVSSRLKIAQKEAETRRVEQGEGAPSAAEIARSITGAFGALASVITSALRFLAKHPLPSAIFIGLIAIALVAPSIIRPISGVFDGIGSRVAGLWDTYVTQPAERNANKTPTSVNSSALKDAVGVGKLVSASAGYEGIAVKTNDKGEEVCHIYYETTVLSYVNANKIEFVIDDENKTVTPRLPDQELDVDIPSTSSITYFEENPDVRFWEALQLCEADAKNEATDNQALIACGQTNLRKIVETLISPVLSGTDYKISW